MAEPTAHPDSWYAWLIERVGNPPQYLDATLQWTDDPLLALHMCRYIDAERFIAGVPMGLLKVRIELHEFVGEIENRGSSGGRVTEG